jgi:hypothetical protein
VKSTPPVAGRLKSATAWFGIQGSGYWLPLLSKSGAKASNIFGQAFGSADVLVGMVISEALI